MHGARDELFATSGLALDQYRGIGWRHSFDLLENLSKYATVANDLLEVKLVADFVFEVKLFLFEFLSQLGDLLVREGIVNRDGNLAGDLNEELNFVRSKRVSL